MELCEVLRFPVQHIVLGPFPFPGPCQPIPHALGTWAHTEAVILGKELCFTLRKQRSETPRVLPSLPRKPSKSHSEPRVYTMPGCKAPTGPFKVQLSWGRVCHSWHQVLSKYPPDQTPPTSNSRLLGKEEAPDTPWPWTSQVRVTKEWAES